ncbi:MAG: polysaccharide deacetylase family protein [Candidatus Aenigmarchaeota archaeon]|nr:polysaccharide deacetylase family protein [Candidatus Aenigmarchaeota archaeon]
MTKELKQLIFVFMLISGMATVAFAAPTYSSVTANTITTASGNQTTLSVFWNSTMPLSTATMFTNETGVWTEYVKPIEYTEELVPILYYHGIGETYPSPYNTKVSDFIAQMDYLYENNYNTITFAELLEHMNSGTKLPEKSVVITFDDGWKDQYLSAFPILKSRGFTATFFIITGTAINNSIYPGYMNISQIQDLYASGMEIACHSKTHPIGGLVNSTNLDIEINESTQDIYDMIGVYPKTFAYPEGVFNDTIIEWVQQNGYIGARAIEKDGVYAGWTEPRFAYLKASANDTEKFTIGSNIIDANTTLNGTSYVSFEKLVNYTRRNEFEDMYSIVSDIGSYNISLEDQFEKDSFSSIAMPDTGDKLSVGVLIPVSDYYNITFRVLTGGWNVSDPSSYNPNLNTYDYFIDAAPYSESILNDYVNDTHTVPGGDNVTEWGYVWGSQVLWNIYMTAGFHDISVVSGNDWNMVDYFTIDYSDKIINAANYYNSPRKPRNYEAWTNFTWKNDSMPFGNLVSWKVYANDTSGNSNTTEAFSFNAIIVNRSLTWNSSDAQTVDVYSPTNYSNFSITWVNNTAAFSEAYLENNFTGNLTNSTMIGTYPNYYYNSSPLAAGTYQYRFVGIDAAGTVNATNKTEFTIAKAENLVSLILDDVVNENRTYVYPEMINATAISEFGNASLYRDEVLVENKTELVRLGNGTYAYKVNATGNQNYSDNNTDVTYYAFVNKGVLNITIDFDPSDVIELGSQTTVYGIENNIGDDDVNYTLYRNDFLSANETPYKELVSPAMGIYNYTFNATGGANYSANESGVWALLTVQQPSPTIIYGGGGGGGYIPPVKTKTEEVEEEEVVVEQEEPVYVEEVEETIEECVEDWVCSDWSSCREGGSVRTCVDANDCGTENSRPNDFQECNDESRIAGMFNFITTPTGMGIAAMVIVCAVFSIFMINRKKIK